MGTYCDKRILRSKAAIKNAFLNLLYKKAFDKITISEIVRVANYNRGTFYANFYSKENLLDEVIQDVLTEMIVQIRQPYKELKKVYMKELNPENITLFTYFKENSDLYKLLLSDHIKVDFRYKMAKAIEKLFIEEYQYELEADSSLNLKWLYVYRSHGIAGLIIRWIEEGFQESTEYMSEQVIELMITATDAFQVKK